MNGIEIVLQLQQKMIIKLIGSTSISLQNLH